MEIQFADAKLQKLCCDASHAQKKLGRDGAQKLRIRLADITAARQLSEVVRGRPHPLSADRIGQFALDLDGARRLILASADAGARSPDGGIDWPAVTAVTVVEIGDYHD